jgi:O-antigen/teichoic acid export membrane protein
MLNFIKDKITKLDIHTLEVVKKSSSSMIVKMTGMFAAFLISVILGRTIGPEGLGIINLSTKIVAFVLIFIMLGMDTVVRKEVAIAFERKDWQHVGNTIFTSTRIILPIAIGISIVLIMMASWLSENAFKEPKLYLPLLAFSVLLIPQAISRIFESGLIGYRKIWQSNLLNETLSLIVVALGLGVMFILNVKITIPFVLLLYGIGRITVLISVLVYWYLIFQFRGKRIKKTKSMLRVGLPLLIVSSTALIASSADTVMLGLLSNSREIGFYSVAAKLGTLTSFFHLISISSLTPKIASLFHENKLKELETMVQQVTKGLGAIGVLSVLIYFFLGNQILSLWGTEFKEAYWILIIIAFGQLVNLGTGATGMILQMTNNERALGYLTLSTAILNVSLNYVLVPLYGGLGASIATAMTLILQNVIQIILVKKKLGILTINFPW